MAKVKKEEVKKAKGKTVKEEPKAKGKGKAAAAEKPVEEKA